MRLLKTAIFAAATLMSLSAPAFADAILNDTNRGGLRSSGGSTGGAGAADGNYLAGADAGSTVNNWFVFNLAGVSGPITGATLTFDMGSGGNQFYGLGGPATATFTLFDYTSNIDNLIANAGNFADLGGGTAFGSGVFSTGAGTGSASIVFNAAGLAAINSGLGNRFAIGGAITDISGAEHFLFGNTLEAPLTTLSLTTAAVNAVPEPLTLSLFGAGVVGAAAMRRRKAKKA